MPHPKDADVYPVGTVVRWKKTGQFALITSHTFMRDDKGFLNYLGEIKDRKGTFAIYHDDLDLEALPEHTNGASSFAECFDYFGFIDPPISVMV